MDKSLVIDSLQTTRFQILSDNFQCPYDASQSASIIIAFEFFGLFVSTHTPSVFWGEGKVVLAFEIIYLFSTDVIFYISKSNDFDN